MIKSVTVVYGHGFVFISCFYSMNALFSTEPAFLGVRCFIRLNCEKEKSENQPLKRTDFHLFMM